MREPALSRRAVLRSGSVLAALAMLEGCSSSAEPEPSVGTASVGTASAASPSAASSAVAFAMPAESRPHTRTFMAWPALEEVWGEHLPAVREDIARVAQAVARFEPVVLMARPEQSAQARQLCGSSVEVIDLAVDDLWARDTGPAFVTGPGGPAGVDLNFNGWGNKQTHGNDSQVARTLLERYAIRRIQAPITGEGGGIEVDGEGTLMATESSWVNENRNPGKSRDQIEASLKELFGVRKVIWFAGVAGQDITDCHIDALARFAEPGVVVIHRPGPDAPPDIWSRASDQALQVLRDTTDAQGRKLRTVELVEPDLSQLPDPGKDFLATYLNYYVVNGAVIMPRFGDKASDDRAAGVLAELHPGRQVVPVEINAIASGGGGIHCSTQQQPEAPAAAPAR
ncbi:MULTISPECIES: agmatine deiminase family protein [unclassified Kitasatospora]|uniref:agmatine deiminase family protein n=1 Tax=unclassified Kitasatospora TaxID=2633591 RepID=UPI000709CCE7|nr:MULTISPECIES: agmatine deiminase family protein [unclassified Kitasatospora]KQV21663.1 peptidyl-arginine deiminase [Kitasatospora sp. Root107]KRB77480.1 peptidyl-arginine deiminase [Kitasatospora sp. Root187]